MPLTQPIAKKAQTKSVKTPKNRPSSPDPLGKRNPLRHRRDRENEPLNLSQAKPEIKSSLTGDSKDDHDIKTVIPLRLNSPISKQDQVATPVSSVTQSQKQLYLAALKAEISTYSNSRLPVPRLPPRTTPYMLSQLVDWQAELCHDLGWTHGTLHLGWVLLLRFMAEDRATPVSVGALQPLGLACLLLAAKLRVGGGFIV